MKILFSSYHNPHFITITEYIENAIKALGHELIVYDDRRHIMPGRIRYRFKYLHKFDLRHLNRKLVHLASEKRPQIAIIAGGHRITAETIRELRAKGILTVLWTIDAPINFRPILKTASSYDHIFCQGTEAIELLEKHGIRGAYWLPMACDPDFHMPVELAKGDKISYGHDLCFVGSYYPIRADLFEELSEFDFGLWGPGWDRLSSEPPLRNLFKGGMVRQETWLKIYSSSKIVLATHYLDQENRFPVYQASPRVFEALACRCFLLVDRQKDVFALFNDGEHLVGFDSVDDLKEKIRYYLSHSEQREKIAEQGYKEVLEKHTFVHRINEMLSKIGFKI
jgi:spore maturation protein CgeB